MFCSRTRYFFLQAASLSIRFLCASTHCWIAVSTITESPKRCYALPLFIVLVPKSSSLLKCYSISLLSAQNVHNHDDLVMQFHTCPKFEYFFNFPIDSIFTGRNEVLAKVIFLHLSVIHSVHRGGRGSPSPGGFSLPPNPPGIENPPGWRTTPPDEEPPHWRTTPPGWRTPLDGEPPPREENPPRWKTTPPRMENHPPPEADSGIRSMIGRYASYWNAFLYH